MLTKEQRLAKRAERFDQIRERKNARLAANDERTAQRLGRVGETIKVKQDHVDNEWSEHLHERWVQESAEAERLASLANLPNLTPRQAAKYRKQAGKHANRAADFFAKLDKRTAAS